MILVAADVDDDDHDGHADGQQPTAAGDAARDAVDLPSGLSGSLSLDPPDAARLLRSGRPIASGSSIGPSDKLQVQVQRPGRILLKASGKDGWSLTLGAIEARWLTSEGAAVDPVRSGIELSRTPPTRLPEDPFSPAGENSFRALLIGAAADLDGSVAAVSIANDGRIIDGLPLNELRDVPCPADVAKGLTCRSTLPLRLALDQTDRAHPVSTQRSIQAELGGAVAIMLGNKKLTHARVVGPRATEVGDIERLRARVRIFLVRDRAKGAPPFGLNDQMAIALARAQLARANAVWGQCGISFGPVADAEIKLVDPPPPTMLAVGCDLGLPAEGGQMRVRVDGRELSVPLLAGESPRAVARKTARALEARGLRATVSDNLRIGPGVDATSDVVVKHRDGTSVRIEPPATGKVSNDPQMRVCIGAVDLTDGLQHFTDVDAVAGTVEERALLRAFDDGDSRTIEVVLVPSFATGGRIGESFIRGDRSSLGNMVIEDRAGIRADNISFALAHELGHVLLDVPGHSDDFGQDTPSRLMDSDAADPSAFGPRRLVLDECVRAVRQSGTKAPTPLLVPWPLGRLPFRHTP